MQRYFHMASGYVWYLLEPGKNGPIPTCRLQLLRESLQEAEAHIFLQNAVLDQRTKLSPELAQRCQNACDERTRFLRFASEMHYDYDLTPHVLEDQAVKLYQMADEVAKALK